MPVHTGSNQIMNGSAYLGDSAVAMYLGSELILGRDSLLSLDDWELPGGKQVSSGPALIQAAAGAGDGGYPNGLWQRAVPFHSVTGFGTLIAGDLSYTVGGVTDTLDEVKYQGATPVSNRWRFAVARFRPVPPDTDASIVDYLSSMTNPVFVIQTDNRTIQLPWSAATDRSAGNSWVSWWLTGSGRANSMLTEEEITEIARVRSDGARFICAWVEDAA